MALSEKKITGYRANIKELSDTPSADGVSAQQLKELFDGRTDEEVRQAVNGIVDELLGSGAAGQLGERSGTVQQALDVCVRSEDVRQLRLNADGVIEITKDGSDWQAAGSGGHLIADAQGTVMPQRSRLVFENTVLRDSGTATVISGIRGEQGEQGPSGPSGERGPQGLRGEPGKAWLPEVDAQGTLRFTLSDLAAAPAPVNIRGPQGVQGMQGMQGVQGPAGPQGVQGEQGVQGVQGPRGERGADGRDFKVLGLFSDIAALQSAHPQGNPGDAYAVGTAQSNSIYLWDSDTGLWRDIGALQGPPGPQGVQGIAGPQGIQGVQGAPGSPGQSAYEQACAAGYAGTQEQFSQSLSNLPQHLDSQDNPHGVTAQQTGAFTVQQSLVGTMQSVQTEQAWDFVCAGGGQFVRLRRGEAAAQVSADGLHWTQAFVPAAGNWCRPCFGGAGFVTLNSGQASGMLSPDGRSWRSITLPEASGWRQVCWGGGRYVALGDAPAVIVYSDNGIDWHKACAPEAPWSAACWGAGRFVAVAGTQDSPSQAAAFSKDGRVWVSAALPRAAAWEAAAYGGEGFAALPSDGGQGAFSADGEVWSAMSLPQGQSLCLLQGQPGRVWALGAQASNRAYLWNGGKDWQPVTLPESAVWHSVCEQNGVFLTASSGALARAVLPHASPACVMQAQAESAKGVYTSGWAGCVMPGSGWTFVDFCGDRYVALASGTDRAAYSFDGEHWTGMTLPAAEDFTRICYGGGRYVVFGAPSSARLLYSDDGLSWNEGAFPTVNTWTSACYGKGMFIAAAAENGDSATSADGAEWQTGTMPKAAGWSHVTFDGSSFHAVTAGNKVTGFSDDGVSWSYRQLPYIAQWRAICGGGGRYVVVGEDTDEALVSQDGISFTRIPLPGGRKRWLVGVCWTGSRFVAVEGGEYQGVLTSPDGEGWTEAQPLPQPALAVGGGALAAVVCEGGVYVPQGELLTERAVRVRVNGEECALFGEHGGAAVTGLYTGTGVRAADVGGGRRVSLGFMPRAVLVRQQTLSADAPGCVMAGRGCPALSSDGLQLLSVTPYGFLAGEHLSTTSYVNAKDVVYIYTAIR